jgi:hypothetical protein
MAGGAETPNIAALPAIARLGACELARGPDPDRRVKLLIQFAVEGSHSGAYSQLHQRMVHVDDLIEPGAKQILLARLPPLPWLHLVPRQSIQQRVNHKSNLQGIPFR